MFYSILVPVYNVEKYLKRTLDSIIEQSFNDYEVILVDDGSTDQSGEICDQYQEKYSDRIKVIHKKNEGLLMARRTALQNANGDYIIHCDSDDYLLKDALEILHNHILETHSDLVIYNAAIVGSGIQADKKLIPQIFQDGNIFEGDQKKLLYEQICKNHYFNSLCTKAYSRRIADSDTNYKKYAFVRNGEDLIQSLPVITNANKILYLEQPLYGYCINASVMTKTYHKDLYPSVKCTNHLLTEYIIKWNCESFDSIVSSQFLKSVSMVITKLATNSCKLKFKQKYDFIKGVSNDTYFIRRYHKISKEDYKELNIKTRLICKLLHLKMNFILALITLIYTNK